jgi:hypothetical protein
MPAHSLGFTYCQLPVCYQLADAPGIVLELANGRKQESSTTALSLSETNSIIGRDGAISRLTVLVAPGSLRDTNES